MLNQIWDDLLTDQDQAVIQKAGYADRGAASWGSRNLGLQPALGIIDMQVHLVGPDVPILEAIEFSPTAIGQAAWRAMDSIASLLNKCRTANVPVFYTRVLPRKANVPIRSIEIVEQFLPGKDDEVFDKKGSSAFFGTRLSGYLESKNIDTLILVGNSTSGCVRATAVDARAHGYDVLVPLECTFDRIEASHKIALLDLWMKYARVVTTTEAIDYVVNLGNPSEEANSTMNGITGLKE